MTKASRRKGAQVQARGAPLVTTGIPDQGWATYPGMIRCPARTQTCLGKPLRAYPNDNGSRWRKQPQTSATRDNVPDLCQARQSPAARRARSVPIQRSTPVRNGHLAQPQPDRSTPGTRGGAQPSRPSRKALSMVGNQQVFEHLVSPAISIISAGQVIRIVPDTDFAPLTCTYPRQARERSCPRGAPCPKQNTRSPSNSR